MKTKMKTTIITASFLLLSTLTYGQTKEETIEWLNNNMELLLPTTYCSGINGNETAIDKVKIENDSLIISREWQGLAKWSVAIKDLLYQETNLNNLSDKPYFKYCPDIVCFIFQSKKDKIEYKSNGSKGVAYPTKFESAFYIKYKKENNNDAMRVVKAIMHLAKLSGATQNKQTF
jgi:hypothetical protein